MTSMRPLAKLGKQPGKQIQGAIGIWRGVPPMRRIEKLSCGFAPSLGAADFRTFEALRMPNIAARPLRSPSNCFPMLPRFWRAGRGSKKRPRIAVLSNLFP